MKRILVWNSLVILFSCISILANAQLIVLNEDFSSASGTNQPDDWGNFPLGANSAATDLWHFDNPGNRNVPFPFTGSFAIFDADAISNNGQSEISVLESKAVDASAGANCVLTFDHFLQLTGGDSVFVDVRVGPNTYRLDTITASTAQPVGMIYNVTQWLAGVTNGRIRFTWKGNGSGFWAIDNIQVNLPASLDAGITDITNPISPFAEGSYPVRVNITNFGVETINNLLIGWSVDGVVRPNVPVTLSQPLSYSQSNSSVSLGNVFYSAGVPVNIVAHIISVNNQADANSPNNVFTADLIASLCGTYTIGPDSSDFIDFNNAISILTVAGVACPVTFLVKPGTYNESINLNPVAGVSNTNNITFRSTLNDNQSVILTNNNYSGSDNYTINCIEGSHFSFERITILRDNQYPCVLLKQNSHDIRISDCILGNVIVPEGEIVNDIYIENNDMRYYYIKIGDYYAYGEDNMRLQNISIINNDVYTTQMYNVENSILEKNYSSLDSDSLCFYNYIGGNSNEIHIKENKTKYFNLRGSNITIEENVINSMEGTPIMGFMLQNTTIKNNYISKRISSSNNFMIYCTGSSGLTITENNINGNMVSEGIAVFMPFFQNPVTHVISKNDIHNTTGQAILINNTNASIEENHIINHSNGVGIKLAMSTSNIINNEISASGSSSAIGVQLALPINPYKNNDNSKIINNSILISTLSSANSTAILIEQGENIELKNNNFTNYSNGYALKLNNINEIYSNNNNYFSGGNIIIQYNNIEFSNISDYISATGRDAESINFNPFYASVNNLSPNQIALKNEAEAHPLATTDINGIIRDNSPDIGAFEFNLCANDIGLNEFGTFDVSNLANDSNIPVFVEISNQGLLEINTAILNWSINQIEQSPFTWNGTLLPGETQDIVIGYVNTMEYPEFNIQATLTEDCNTYNSQINSGDISAPLCGTYTIGANSDFTSIESAVNALNSYGISCPVTFNISEGNYYENVLISNITGSSPENTISFVGINSSNAVTNIYPAIESSPPIILIAAKNISFNNVSIHSELTEYCVLLGNQTENISFASCKLQGVHQPLGSKTNKIDFYGCNFSDSKIEFTSAYYLSKSSNITIDNCILNDIEITAVDSLIIRNCSSSDSNNYRLRIFLNDNKYCNVENNLINIITSGSDTLLTISNNHIIGTELYNYDYPCITMGRPISPHITNNILESGHNHSSPPLFQNSNLIWIFEGKNGVISDNQFRGAQFLSGISIYNDEIMSGSEINMTVRGNIFEENNNFAIYTRGENVDISNNRIVGFKNGTAIKSVKSNNIISNNFITGVSVLPCVGIGVVAEGNTPEFINTCEIFHNNILIESSNFLNSSAININDGINHIIKNNIFQNNSGGICAKYNLPLLTLNIDYNNYYTSGPNITYVNGTIYENITEYLSNVNLDSHSLSVNPLFTSYSNLKPNQFQLNDNVPMISGYNYDINGSPRSSLCDFGASEFTLCSNDLAINRFIDLDQQLPYGIVPISIELQNNGQMAINHAQISWSVNDQNQAPFIWDGYLPAGQRTFVNIGQYLFSEVTIYEVKAWVVDQDCNNSNDTCSLRNIGLPLCGNYTVGGSNCNFNSLTDASNYLNNIGISCPVVISIRNGQYNEQINLSHARGSSQQFTVTFQSEDLDSLSVILNKPNVDSLYPYVIGLFGSQHTIFRHLSIQDTVQIEVESNNILIEKSTIESIINTGYLGNISEISIMNSSITGSNINIGSTNTFGLSTNMIIRNCNFDNLQLINSNNAIIELNNNLQPIENYIYSCDIRNCQEINLKKNNIQYININATTNADVIENQFAINSARPCEIYNSSYINISNNHINSTFGGFSENPLIELSYSKNLLLHKNHIDCNNNNTGIEFKRDEYSTLVDTSVVSENTILNAHGFGIKSFRHNISIEKNKILNFRDGNAIRVDGRVVAVINNYIQGFDQGNTAGITLPQKVENVFFPPVYDFTRIHHNSVNITSDNAQFGRALEVLDNYPADIRNNIFSNQGGGFAAFINSNYSNLQLDYNCYYSTAGNFGSYNGSLFNNLSSWGQAVGGDANSIELNPFFESETELLPYQRQINGAGGPCNPPVLLDIDGEIRNQLAPDMGAQEFMIDFGITDLLSPTLDCYQSNAVPVTIALRQFGDIPFIDLQLAYQLNNGTIYTNTIPGAIDDDIEFTFNNLVDLSQEGTYLFKIWLVDNTDDNIFNDTLFIERFRKPSPVVNFNFTSACANSAVNFNGSATISQGSIVLTEWDFGDGETAEGLNTTHIYDVSGAYDVTFRAYSNEGCYSETTQQISLLPTPDVTFTWQGSCVNSNVVFTNGTTLPPGTGSVTYSWNFGDGTTSALETPMHQYTTPGTYTVALTVSNQNGCSDTYTASIEIYDLPLVSFTLPSSYDLNLPSLTLVGNPPGGVFSGPGIIGDVFAPALAGIGNHTIVYEYTNGATGCTAITTQTINVFNSLCVDPEITSQPATFTEACLNTSGISISVTASGTQLNYQWYQASSLIAVGSPIPNAISAQYEPSTAALGTTYYYCRISFPNGCYAVSERGAFEVLPVETPTFSAFPSYCQGASPAALPLQSTNGYEGTWSPAAISTSTPGTSVYTFNPNTGECASQLPITIVVTPATLPVFNVALSYCVGDQINPLPTTSANNISGLWTPAINNQSTTTYTFTPAANQCALPTTLTIVINPIETPIFDPIGSLCSGQTAPVLFDQSNNGINGSWSPSVISNTTSDFYTFTPAAGECANSVTLFVEVNPLPQATISGGTSVCTGENATVQFSGTPNATVSYTRDNGPVQFITLNSAGSASVSTGFLVINTTFTLINAATTTCLATLNGSTSFTVVPASNAGIGSSLFLCNDVTEVDLYNELSGSPTPNGTWNGPSTLANGFLGTFDPAIHQTGAYTYAVPGAANCPPSTATIFVNISNGPSTSISYNGPFCTSLTGSQLPQISGSFGGTFNAYPSGLNITPAGGITPSTSSPGSYLVVYTPLAGTGCSGGTISTIVEITSPPVANIAAGGPLAFCAGNDVVLTATPGSSYLWSNGETSQSITTSVEGSYTVTVFNGTSCSAVSNTLNVNVLPVPGDQILAAGSTTFCAGGSVTLTASPGETYLWNTGATNPSITVNQDGVYQVEVTNAFDCSTLSEAAVIEVIIPTPPVITPSGTISICSDESATLTASGANSYLWNTGSAANTINVVNAGSYSVTGTDAQGCVAVSIPVQVIVSPVPSPIVSIVGGTTFCNGSSTTLTAAGADSYLWSNGAQTQSITVDASGVYSVTLFNGNNCSATSSDITISVADSFTFFRDDDEDGFGDTFDTLSGCVIPPGYSLNGGDCNDSNSSISPIAQEICDDGIDNNCFMGIDENCEGAGCIDPLACNYDSLAVSPDGSCTYPGCNDPAACNYNPLAGCLDEGSCITGGCDDPTACNFNVSALCNDGSCTYEGCMDTLALNYNPQAGCDDGSCLYIQGCMDSAACNYNPQATQDNGDCTYPGCASELACNFDPAAGCDDGSCSYPGCTDPNAFNYDSAAGCNDGSCFYVEGCTDSTACNFNEDAGINDGSCTFPGCLDVNACNYNANAGCAGGLCYYMNMGNIDGNTIVATDSIYSYSYTCEPGCTADFSMTPLLGLITPIDECSVEILWSSEVNDFAELTATITCDNGCTGEENLTILVSAMEEISNAVISAYPNPTAHDFVLSLDAAHLGSSIEVFNTLGMHVYSCVANDFNTTIVSSTWPAGIYTLQVSNENDRYTLQVVKQ